MKQARNSLNVFSVVGAVLMGAVLAAGSAGADVSRSIRCEGEYDGHLPPDGFLRFTFPERPSP